MKTIVIVAYGIEGEPEHRVRWKITFKNLKYYRQGIVDYLEERFGNSITHYTTT